MEIFYMPLLAVLENSSGNPNVTKSLTKVLLAEKLG